MSISELCLFLLQIVFVYSYTFQAPIDNLLYVRNTSTLFAISSSHLHQLHWSTNNRTLLLLHRRVQLHSSIDNSEYGVSVFVYDPSRQLLIICARSHLGRCILYDANDISRIHLLDSSIETNYLGCLTGCYTFMSSSIIRSALFGNRLERNGNIINSQIELAKDLLNYNIKYQFASSDHTLITSLTFLPERLANKEFVYGFDDEIYTYFIMKSSRIARSCQATVAMSVTYEEIPLVDCKHIGNQTKVTGAFYRMDSKRSLFIIYDDVVCVYSMNDIKQAFHASREQCQAGIGYRLAHIVDSVDGRPMCEKTLEANVTDSNQCNWQPYRTNIYMDGLIGVEGAQLYQTEREDIKIQFLFAEENIVIIGNSDRRVLKFIRANESKLDLVHEALYNHGPFNHQYVVDDEHESLIFAVGSELHRYAYNSCALYDTCQSCLGSRRFDDKACIWLNGQCSLSFNVSIHDRGCPPTIDQIQPINIDVNLEQIPLTVSGSFHGVHSRQIKVTVKFPLPNQNIFPCSIQQLHNESLTCNLVIPKQPVEGTVSIEIKPRRLLLPGDTDLSGSLELPEKLNVYVPQPILQPDSGPMAGGTRIRIKNLFSDLRTDILSAMKIFFGQQPCDIIQITGDYIECINQACANDHERLSLQIMMNNQSWQIQPTFFQCRANPIVNDWFPKKTIISGGLKLFVQGDHFDAIQKPLMKLMLNRTEYELITPCESTNRSTIICISPSIDRDFISMVPFNMEISFIMDNMYFVPDDNSLNVGDDPVYYSFDNHLQGLISSTLLDFHGANLSITNEINVEIDEIDDACIPVNLTDRTLQCQLTAIALKHIENGPSMVNIHVGQNLSFAIGKLIFPNQTHASSIPYLTKQLVSWTLLILIVLSSITILSIVFLLVIILRRYYFRSSNLFNRNNKPPQYYQDVWCELGKKWQINLKNLTLGEKIGQGCFGDVFRGELKRSNHQVLEVAVKVLRDQNVAAMHEFLYEANRMKDFLHPNVLSLVGVAWDSIRKAMVLLPYMKNGDLRSYISNEKNRPTVRQLITWGIQVADGMEYLSSLKFVHRDLATRNCMLDENLICRISDFGLTRDIIERDYYLVPKTSTTKDQNGHTIQIPPRRLPIRWLSPESIESSKYTIQSDVWSFGVLLWELMSRGKTPYTGIDNADIYTYVKNGYRLPQPTYCPPLLYKSAMYPCWNVDPTQRPSFTQLAHDIRHILHQLELEQQQQFKLKSQQLSSSAEDDDDDTTIVERYSADKQMKRLSATSVSSSTSLGGQYITTPHRQSENIQLIFDRDGDEDDSYAVAVNASADVFSTTRLLPKYTETSISEDA